MIYYIDFDCTLYDTEKLIDEMINDLSMILSNNDNYDEIFNTITHEFKVKRVPDVFKFCEYCAEKYNKDANILKDKIKTILRNGSKFIYSDTIEFLNSLKHKKIKLLTYCTRESTEYQQKKIMGSGLANYFDEIIITNSSKGVLNIDYSNGFFIDDSPKAITEIYKSKPLKLIRLNRPNSTYSKIKLPEDINIPEVKTLSEIITNQDYNEF